MSEKASKTRIVLRCIVIALITPMLYAAVLTFGMDTDMKFHGDELSNFVVFLLLTVHGFTIESAITVIITFIMAIVTGELFK